MLHSCVSRLSIADAPGHTSTAGCPSSVLSADLVGSLRLVRSCRRSAVVLSSLHSSSANSPGLARCARLQIICRLDMSHAGFRPPCCMASSKAAFAMSMV